MIKKITFDKSIKLNRNVACIGYFDGVHKGHQSLISKTVEIANKSGLEPYLITFKPDPYEVIHKKKNLQITSFNQRLKLFEKFGIKAVVIIDFNEDLMNKSYEYFNGILETLNIDTLVCGYDFTYGYMAKGNIKTIRKCQFKVQTVKEVKYYGKKVSSTRIRNEINKGNYKLVNKLLGYEYK